MNVLSLFDGMSCGHQAIDRAGLPVTMYYASEIDKYAIKVTQANYPETKQLGSVVDVDGYSLPKIDLLLGGSPCQSFSFAGKRKGMSTTCEQEIVTLDQYLEMKAEGFEFEGQSYLFWEYMRILSELRTQNSELKFLLENVIMGEKWERILSHAIGVHPIEINSALVSAQNRRRLYWTNIGMQPAGFFGDLENIIPQPKDKGIFLKDILENEVDDKYFLSDKMLSWLQSHSDKKQSEGCGFMFKTKEPGEKANTINQRLNKMGVDDNYVKCFAIRGRNSENSDSIEQQIEPRKDNKTNTLTSVQKDNMIIQLSQCKESGGKQPYQQNRIYSSEGLSPALMAQMSCGTHNIYVNSRIRRLTPVECERLQTVKEGYTGSVSDAQRYKMLGNGWTIDVIAHILKFYNS